MTNAVRGTLWSLVYLAAVVLLAAAALFAALANWQTEEPVTVGPSLLLPAGLAPTRMG